MGKLESEKATDDKNITIDPLTYLGKDLREIPEDEVEQVLANYGTLRDSADGYALGQALFALQKTREGAASFPALKKLLETPTDPNEWIFKGSVSRQQEGNE